MGFFAFIVGACFGSLDLEGIRHEHACLDNPANQLHNPRGVPGWFLIPSDVDRLLWLFILGCDVARCCFRRSFQFF